MKKNYSLKILLFSLVVATYSTSNLYAAGWCGISQKFDCGGWVVQMAVFQGGAMGPNDCVEYDGCINSAQWDWSNTGAWSQLFVEKSGFCGVDYQVSNTKSFDVSYDGSFSNASGNRRIAIVSWAKSMDDCNWTVGDIFELYLHERSYDEVNNYADWCTYKGESPECSGSTYKLYDCREQILAGTRSIRAWRNEPRTAGTTNVDCLWEAWREIGTVPDVYYYFAEVGTEVGPVSSGRFNLASADMVRTEDNGILDPVTIEDGGIYKVNANGKYLAALSSASGADVLTQNSNATAGQEWIVSVIDEDENIYTLESMLGGNFLTVDGSSDASNVIVASASGESNQEWKFEVDDQGAKRKLIDQSGMNYLTGAVENDGSAIVNTAVSEEGTQDWLFEHTGRNINDVVTSINFDAFSNTLDVFNSSLANVAVYSLNGQVKYQSSSFNSRHVINTSDFERGLYIIQTSYKNGSSDISKVILADAGY